MMSLACYDAPLILGGQEEEEDDDKEPEEETKSFSKSAEKFGGC